MVCVCFFFVLYLINWLFVLFYNISNGVDPCVWVLLWCINLLGSLLFTIEKKNFVPIFVCPVFIYFLLICSILHTVNRRKEKARWIEKETDDDTYKKNNNKTLCPNFYSLLLLITKHHHTDRERDIPSQALEKERARNKEIRCTRIRMHFEFNLLSMNANVSPKSSCICLTALSIMLFYHELLLTIHRTILALLRPNFQHISRMSRCV